MRRRRASGGPAEQTFATLVGLELRPRRLRDAASLWGAMGQLHGNSTRDSLWTHPDLLPTADDLDDPLSYASNYGKAPELSVPDLADFDLTVTVRTRRSGGEPMAPAGRVRTAPPSVESSADVGRRLPPRTGRAGSGRPGRAALVRTGPDARIRRCRSSTSLAAEPPPPRPRGNRGPVRSADTG